MAVGGRTPGGSGQGAGRSFLGGGGDPFQVTASLRRFLSPRRHGRRLLDITHADGATGEIGLLLDIIPTSARSLNFPAAPVTALAAQGNARLTIPVPPGRRPASRNSTVSATLSDGSTLTGPLSVPVQVNDPEVADTIRLTLAPGQTLPLDASVFAGFRPRKRGPRCPPEPLGRASMPPGCWRVLDALPLGLHRTG